MPIDARAVKLALLCAACTVLISARGAAQEEGVAIRSRPLIVRDLVPAPLALHDFEAREWQENDSGYGVIDDRKKGGVIDTRPSHAAIEAGLRAEAERSARAAQGIDLQHRLSEVHIEETHGSVSVDVETDHGALKLSADEYVRAIKSAQDTQKSNGFLYVLFNITHTWGFVWVGAGFLAQALFTYRMILQWWASEKHKRSVVPVGYWWGSLFGGVLLFAYFVWRKDIVGYLGQSTGVFIYARNLVLIYRGQRIEAEGARPLHADEPPPGGSV